MDNKLIQDIHLTGPANVIVKSTHFFFESFKDNLPRTVRISGLTLLDLLLPEFLPGFLNGFVHGFVLEDLLDCLSSRWLSGSAQPFPHSAKVEYDLFLSMESNMSASG